MKLMPRYLLLSFSTLTARMLWLPVSLLLFWASCTSHKNNTLFTEIAPGKSGIEFENSLPEQTASGMNIVQYLYYYNGGGVAAGDVNKDGLTDLYFSSNLGPNQLYLNQGDFHFEDATNKAGVGGQGSWKTGVTMADVNGDGWLDIYVCQVGKYKSFEGKNQLFINNQDGSFTESAAAYGLDLRAFCTQAAFFDYDLDGDLDCFVLCHSIHSSASYRDTAFTRKQDPLAADHLFRNDGGHFTDVSEASAIFGGAAGYGLGLAIGDLNNDGYPDIYVGNDFHENDYLYLNQAGKRFVESIGASTGHTSNFTMGCSMADINNDARPDLLTLDMKPADEQVLKASQPADQYDIYQYKHQLGYHWQLPHNCLQVNVSTQGPLLFSELAYLTGLAATDWSWSPLMADFDLDGQKDVFISNGIVHRPNDLDYLKYISSADVQRNASDLDFIRKMPSGAVSNCAFRNMGNLSFENVSEAWGLNHKGCSNGALYADLDNDGDLDVVCNNLNEPATVFRNNSTNTHWLKIRFEGAGNNPFGIGAQVKIWVGGELQYAENQPVHGFQSAGAPELLFGLGAAGTADSLYVGWPGGSSQKLRVLPSNTLVTLRQSDARDRPAEAVSQESRGYFQPFALPVEMRSQLRADQLNVQEKLAPWLPGAQAPRLAVGDVNGDGLEDVFLPGAAPNLYIQQKNGGFLSKTIADIPFATCAAVFRGSNKGPDQLYIGQAFKTPDAAQSALRDLIWVGGIAQPDVLPDMLENTACVRPCDFDGDGDQDLFVGGRSVDGAYGMPAHSYLLENDGAGHFKDATIKAPGLGTIGMVTDAQWLDLDKDKRPELVLCGEWMPIYVFLNTPTGFVKTKMPFTAGFWNCLSQADLDGDGDQDLVAGNLGLNTPLRGSRNEPVGLWVRDFDGNGSFDPVMSWFRDGENYVFQDKDWLLSQLPGMKKDYVQYEKYAESNFKTVFPGIMKQPGLVLHKAAMLSSSWFENMGDGTVVAHGLPVEAQVSPVFAALPGDFDGDGKTDLLLAGNFYEVQPAIGRQDASYGTLLRGDGNGNFKAVLASESGFLIQGPVRDLQMVHLAGGKTLVLAVPREGAVKAWQIHQVPE